MAFTSGQPTTNVLKTNCLLCACTMIFAVLLGFYLSFQSISPNNAARTSHKNVTDDWKHAESVYDFHVRTIEGEDISMRKYEGFVLLIVNVASKCGYTDGHYKELVQLDQMFRGMGLRILAFPCNQFGGQEPGNSKTIADFVASKGAMFDVFEKINVNGDDAHPLWKFLKSKKGGLLNDDIKWNFTKFIIDRSGQPVERHAGNVSPSDIERDLERYL